MGKRFDALDDRLVDWISRQRMFFVATAPSGPGGHVNISPKGWMPSFRVLDPGSVAYLDVVGSGAETIAHLRDNGRIVVMFCAFEGPPRILRLHGHGDVVQPGEEGFDELAAGFAPDAVPADGAATRAVIRVRIERIADSCGYNVPLMDYAGEREQYGRWVDNRLRTKGPDALTAYEEEHNRRSIDGLPALRA